MRKRNGEEVLDHFLIGPFANEKEIFSYVLPDHPQLMGREVAMEPQPGEGVYSPDTQLEEIIATRSASF